MAGFERIAWLSVVLFGMLTAAQASSPSAQWLLKSRHGECTDVGPAIRHKFRDIPLVSSPEQFVQEMKTRGIAVKVTNAYGGNRDAVLVEVPVREASLVFVAPGLCREIHRR